MITREEDSVGAGALPEDVLHITPEQPRSPTSPRRFIVEPQVLNAAFEFEGKRHTVSPSTRPPVGGLPPPPRPNRPPRSNPSSPIVAGDPWPPNSPLSSPYSNPPDTPGSPDGSLYAAVRTAPRLSNILRGESFVFSSMRRHSLVEEPEDAMYDGGKPEYGPGGATMSPWGGVGSGGGREQQQGDEVSSPQGSFQGSLPSSPESSGTPVDGSRPPRQNRYLSGLQKITKLGKAKPPISMFAPQSGPRGGETEVRSARRMSDVTDLEPAASRRTGVKKAGSASEDLSSRYRRMLDKGVRTAGELMKPSTSTSTSSSVPSSPVAGSAKDDDRHGVREAGSGATSAAGRGGETSARGSPRPIGASHRVWRSHGRRSSDLSQRSHQSSSSVVGSFSPSDSSHEPPSSSEPRISISSTIYSSDDNTPSNDHHTRYPHPHPSMSTSSDRESFIDFASPRTPEFSIPPVPPQYLQRPSYDEASPFSNASIHGKPPSRSSSPPRSSTKPRLARLVPPNTLDKPPIPTAPKPDFSHRSRSANRSSPIQSKKHSPLSNFASDIDPSLPSFSTSNALTARERAERIRQTRKLAQVFGQPPGVSPVSLEPDDSGLTNGCIPIPIPAPLALNLTAKRKQHRPVASLSVSDDVANAATPVHGLPGDVAWPPSDETRYVTLAPRRHSAPMSPDEFAYNRMSTDSALSSIIHIGSVQGTPNSDAASSVLSRRGQQTDAGPGSPTSFIDLSDEEGGNDGLSESLVETPRASRGRGAPPFSPSTASLAESFTSDELAEEERRRKREKLAKLHRFLGSRVPPHLVLGPLEEGTPLPPPAPSPLDPVEEEDIRKVRMRRRRSSSAAEFSRTWSDDIDRLKEELNEREKAINVRRAIKMEKMFGVAPPQTLYHTRAPVASTPNFMSTPRQPSPSVKASPRSPATPPFRFTPGGPSSKAKKQNKRPGTSDSSEPLINERSDNGFLDVGSSSVYMHYRHSLNSLNDIIDRDDKKSLAELHDYLTGAHYETGDQYDYQFSQAAGSGGPLPPIPGPTSPLLDDLSLTSSTSTTKAERRRSLPSRVSIASFTSELSVVAPTPTEASFQQRRRRAAKLTHFFGVDYRDLMGEILESIEKGLEEERGKGTLKPDEVRDLQQKIVSLRTKRNSLSGGAQ